jgi:hypothetical protein
MSSELRRASPADNDALIELFGARPMEGRLVLSTRRDPDFFALYAMQRGDADCWVFEKGGRLLGLGTILTRDGWLNGRPARVGYLGDLRARFGASRASVLAREYGEKLDDARRTRGCEAFYTAVLASNVAALQALVRRRGERHRQPAYHLLRRFAMVSVQFAGRRHPPAGDLRVRTATPDDVAPITALLDRDHRRRPFGYRYDAGELEHRLAHWPGLLLERTYVALDRDDRLVGVTSAWDPAAVKRYRVLEYRGGMRWSRILWNAVSRPLGFTPLPAPGSDFHYLYLVNTSIAGDDPAVFRALAERIYADFHGRGYHFFSTCEYEADPLASALHGFMTRRLDFHLYSVTPAGEPAPDVGPGRTGFEMALA